MSGRLCEEDVLMSFAVETSHSRATLNGYITRHPKHARALRKLAQELARDAVLRRFHFVDDGQDFLQWDVTTEGKVVGCEPFQFSIWSKCEVVAPFQYKQGDRLAIVLPSGERRRLQHDIERIEKIDKRRAKGGAS